MALAIADNRHTSPNSPALGLRFLLLAMLSIFLLVTDHRNNHLDAARKAIGAAVYPLLSMRRRPYGAGLATQQLVAMNYNSKTAG